MNFLVELIFPPFCVVCRKLGNYLCNDCTAQLVPHPEICRYTHKYSEGFATHLDVRNQSDVFLDGCIIGFSYTHAMQLLIKNFKYYHRYDLGESIAKKLALHIQSNPHLREVNASNTTVTSVPSHRWRKHFVKGYNQSELLADAVAGLLGVRHQPLCRKTKHTSAQAKLSRQQRLVNMSQVFVTGDVVLDDSVRLILLVDDVTTTGSTLNEVARVLKKRYPDVVVWGVVVARNG